MLEFCSISKTFPGVKALSSVSFVAQEGRVHGLIGENGAGKSTLLKVLGGAYRPELGGELKINGSPVLFNTPRDAIAKGVAIIHQELQLVPTLSIMENMMLGHYPLRHKYFLDKSNMKKTCQNWLAKIHLDIDPKKTINKLTIGQMQMVEIAKALMLEAGIIAFDEPTSSLSESETKILFQTIQELRNEGRVIIYISHRMPEIFQLCDSCTVLKDGEVVVSHPSMRDVTRDSLVENMTGRKIGDLFAYYHRPIGAEMLSVAKLTGKGVTSPITFKAHKGEILGFFGLIGAGRSELMKIIYGASAKYSGEIRINGQLYKNPKEINSVSNGLMFCTEDRKNDGIIFSRPVSENINISTRKYFNYCAGIFLNHKQEAMNAKKYKELLSIKTPDVHQIIDHLSGGNQQKVILSRWLSDPALQILIVDEPTRGIDVSAKREIYEILYGLAEKGKTIIVVSSEIPEIMGISDRIIIMREGIISGSLERAEYSEKKILSLAFPNE